MPIKECCNAEVVCCEPNTLITEVASLMRLHHVGDVIVVEHQNGARIPAGIVTDRDIVIEIVSLQLDMNVFTAGDIMSAPPVTVLEDSGFVDALRVMREHKVRRLPVVTASGELTGIVSATDIMKILMAELSMMADAIAAQPAREARLRR
jgi:CBS domain-containing protein